MSIAKKVKKYAVRIWNGDSICGSGVLWKSKQEELYVFTAAHVVKDCTDIKVEFERDDKKVKVDKAKTFLSKKYQQEGDWFDIAIIKLDYKYPELSMYRLADWEHNIAEAEEEQVGIIWGFPENTVGEPNIEDNSFSLARSELEVKLSEHDKEKYGMKYIVQTPNINSTDRDRELIGLSGSGIFIQIGSEYVLAGIHKGAAGDGAPRGELIGTMSDYIKIVCEENGLDIPFKPVGINGDLSDRKNYFREEILNELEDKDYSNLRQTLVEILGQDRAKVIESVFCNFCEECEYKKSYHQCEYFRGYLLVLLVFLKQIKKDINLEAPKLNLKENTPIYFICSEGRAKSKRDIQTKLKLSQFVYALKSDAELSHRLENNCIIIWGSRAAANENQRHCNSDAYDKYLLNITRYEDEKLDITTPSSAIKVKVIIHVDDIIRMLQDGNLKELETKFKKYIEDLENGRMGS